MESICSWGCCRALYTADRVRPTYPAMLQAYCLLVLVKPHNFCHAAVRPGDRHTSLALYILLRGITLLIRCGNKPDAPPAIRKALAPTRWTHGDTALMCLATSQITYSWIMMPHTLPKSYVKFLNKHGGRQQWHYDAAKVGQMDHHMWHACTGSSVLALSTLVRLLSNLQGLSHLTLSKRVCCTCSAVSACLMPTSPQSACLQPCTVSVTDLSVQATLAGLF